MKSVPIEAIVEAENAEGTVFALARDGRRVERRLVTIAFVQGARVAISGGPVMYKLLAPMVTVRAA